MNRSIRTFGAKFNTDNLLLGLKRSVGCGDFEVHRHVNVEMMVVIGGQARHIINGMEFDAHPGDMFILFPGMTHELREMQNFDEVKIGCIPGAFSALVPELELSDGFRSLFLPPRENSRSIPRLQLKTDEYSYVRQIVLKMVDEYNKKTIGWQPAIRSSFCMLLVTFLRAFNRKMETFNPILYHLNETISYMENNFSKCITLYDLAQRTGLSESQFVRVFRKNYGTSPIDYLINIRLANACRLLLSSDKTVTEIALECGYNDCNYFSRQFKRKIGAPPCDYRDVNLSDPWKHLP